MSLFGGLEIGRKGLAAGQTGQSTAGNNIANVDTEGFSRREVTQATAVPAMGGKGSGVDVTGVRRFQDRFVKAKVVDEQTRVGNWQTRESILTEAEVIYTDLDGTRLRGSLDAFWNAWETLSHEPESIPARKALAKMSDALTKDFKLFDQRLTELEASLNQRILSEIEEVNKLTREIATMNKQVEQLESKGLQANDARDQREMLLQKLADKVSVKSYESKTGTLEIQLDNGQHLVRARKSYNLSPIPSEKKMGDFGISLTVPPNSESNVTDAIEGGILNELIRQRDTNVAQFHNDLHALARELATEVNNVHATGTGIKGAQTSETSAYPLPADALLLPLPFLQTGEVEFKIVGQDGEIEEVLTVPIEAGVDSPLSVVDKINKAADAYATTPEGQVYLKDVSKLRAQLNENGTITLESGMGKKFIYGKDGANLLGNLGLNCFFHFSEGASDIEVNRRFIEDEQLIAAGSDMLPGDNLIALTISELKDKAVMDDGTLSFGKFYNKQITDVGLKVHDAQKGHAGHRAMLEQYEALRDTVSAVNLDEEMANMVKYQRAYESAAKFLGTIDQMTETVINM